VVAVIEFDCCASEGPFGPRQVSHRARAIENSDGRYITACGKEFGGPGNMHPDWDDWGVGGPFDGDEWPPITCDQCAPPAPAGVDILRTRLDELDALRAAALRTPWTEPDVYGSNAADAALIVAAVNALPELLRAARERDALLAGLEELAEQSLACVTCDEHGWTACGVDHRATAGRIRAVVKNATGGAQ
jgi:hypothetical protein